MRAPRMLITLALMWACSLALVVLLLPGSFPQPATGVWAPAGNMSVARTGACAVLLKDGRVLVTGGSDSSGNLLATAEFLSPATGAFSAAPPMFQARTRHACALLPDGRVLVAGGAISGGAINATEIFDPVSNSWAFGPAMAESRAGHTATVLKDGRVLLAGGERSSQALNTVEVYDPATNSFAAVGFLSTARKDHGAALLPDGKVWIGGGHNGSAELASVEIYDPVSGASTSGPPLSAPRSRFIALALPLNGHILIAGGSSGGAALGAAELYRPWTASYVTTGALGVARAGAAAAPAGIEGYAVAAGGSALASAEVYAFATVKTDKADYAPGETVTITGAGWVPGETVTLQLHEVPTTHSDRVLTAVADASGRIFNNSFSPESHDLGVTFYLTAIGSLSQAQAVFTDDQTKINQVNLKTGQNPSPVTAGFSATYVYDVVFNRTGSAGSNSCTVQMSVTTTGSETGLPSGASASFSPSQLTQSGAGTLQTTLTITTTSAVAPGTYTFTVRATGTGGAGNDCGTGDFRQQPGQTLVVAPPANTAPAVAFIAPPTSANEGETKTFSFQITDPDSGQTFSFESGFPDCGTAGTLVAGSATINNSTKTGSFQCSFPDGPANPLVRVQVRDSASASSNIATVSVTVNNVAPAVTLTGPGSADEGSTQTYTFTVTDPGQDPFTLAAGYPRCGANGSLVGSVTTNSTGGSFQCKFPDGPASSDVEVQVSDSDGASSNIAKISVTVNNVAPTVALTGPSSAHEGSTQTYTFTVTDPGQDTFTLAAGYPRCGANGSLVTGSVTTNGTGGSFQCNFPDGPALSDVEVQVSDSDGASSNIAKISVTVRNVPPAIASLDLLYSASSINENGTVTLYGTFSDPGTLDSHTVVIDWGDGSPPTQIDVPAGSPKAFTATHQYLDDNPTGTPSDTYTITVTVTDKDGGTGAGTTSITVNNVPPVLDNFTASAMVVAINTPVTFTAGYTDEGTLDTHTCAFNFDDGTGPQNVTGATANGSGSCTATRSFPSAGVYTVTAKVQDDDTGESATKEVLIAVYDPSAGFVTGGGWINSPAGAYFQDPDLTGRANFGFVSKYKKGATTPEGQTEFQFKTGNLNFHSSSYEWLVVAGAKAQFKGSGTINGTGDYGFLLTAYDADVNKNDSILTDKFRIKIWDKSTGDTIYDNNYVASDDIDIADPQDIAGGSIVIHSK
ncbi:MAG TPA: kelch repeat-containing protein [Bryobacteraceae bacterium]|nr:kelch repeat-containing protein [Bryobacteraceae bacterium]